uniref:Uncharacterized protein n=1 Tax=Anguilla anguilla TaxID=7936 RepID=A0A0E9TA66_ANGAN
MKKKGYRINFRGCEDLFTPFHKTISLFCG